MGRRPLWGQVPRALHQGPILRTWRHLTDSLCGWFFPATHTLLLQCNLSWGEIMMWWHLYCDTVSQGHNINVVLLQNGLVSGLLDFVDRIIPNLYAMDLSTLINDRLLKMASTAMNCLQTSWNLHACSAVFVCAHSDISEF